MSLFDGMAEIFRDTFGEAVIYTPAGAAPLAIEAIYFETPLTIAHDDGGAPVDSQAKELHVAAADVAAPREGDRATVRGVTYKVVPPFRPDGQGMIAVSLVRLS
ncbi:head-tail joining protein [Reyranella sp.]|uniref:head-tail joining protein n=1 Tax=Reyranella sp. TaxID=1929291 RepID=UPI003F71626B